MAPHFKTRSGQFITFRGELKWPRWTRTNQEMERIVSWRSPNRLGDRLFATGQLRKVPWRSQTITRVGFV